ncbi:MAG: ABC transporter ATP-binding protein [Bacteroidetes bacterium]|nr:ABC transporter ATP-binding protein [Bacteroidota bacterium]
MKDLLRVFKYIKPYKSYALLNIMFNILFILFSFLNISLLLPTLNVLFGLSKPVSHQSKLSLNSQSILDNFNYYIGKLTHDYGAFYVLIVVALLFILFSFLNNLFKYLGMYFLAPIRNGMVKDLRNDMYNKLLILPISFYADQKKGDLMSRTTSDINEIEWSVVSTLQMVIKDPLNVIFFLIVLLSISPKLVVLSLITLLPAGFLIGKIGKSLKRNSEKGQRQLGVVIATTEESITGLRIIKAFNAIDYALDKFKKINRIYTKLMTKVYWRKELAAPLTETMAIIGLLIVIWFGGNMVLKNSLSAELLIFFVVIFGRMIPPAQSFITSFYNLQRGAAAAQRIFEIIDAEEKIEEKENAIEKKSFTQNIEYRNVSFQYNEEQTNVKVLDTINLTIAKGKMIALVGPSGGGKSTLVDLLPRFYDCTEGEILIDGIPIKDLVISDIRDLIGIVSQETILFNDTIMNNIAFGMKNISEADVIAAAKVANAHDFITALENGYHTNIGDRGANLSGGQRQRISIARAVLKNPPIMILDEATSALDTESERYVQEALTNLMKNRTSVVIAHRLSTINNADEIVVIENGKIIERGTHLSLIENDGLYNRLIKLQSFTE